MPKKIEDIITPEKLHQKSIRNIPIPESRVKLESHFNSLEKIPGKITINRRAEPDVLPNINTSEKKESEFVFKPKRPKAPNSRKIIIGSSIVGVLLIGFALLSLFRSATLTYTPKTFALSFNKDSFTAYKSGGEKDLMFSVVKLSGNKGVEAKASGEEKVSMKASGKAVVYNTASASIKLIRNTRFETTDNKVYRVLTDITVPGKKGDVPGSLEINLYADQPGADYDIPLSDFTVPGLKGDPRYSTVYARSKTPMTGGFVGMKKQVSDADLAKAKAVLEVALKTELMNQAKAQVPADFILYPGLIVINYSDLPQTAPTNDSVTLNEGADFYGVMFKRSDLNNYLALKKSSQGIPNRIDIPNLESLTATLQKQTTVDFLKADQITFELTGNATAVAIVGEENLKKDLAGTPKSNLNTILSKYPDIENADASIKPFWKSSFPSNPSEIKIINTSLK